MRWIWILRLSIKRPRSGGARRRRSTERSVSGGTGVLGRSGREGCAYQNRKVEAKINVEVAWQGAHRVVGDSSPEFANASGAAAVDVGEVLRRAKSKGGHH